MRACRAIFETLRPTRVDRFQKFALSRRKNTYAANRASESIAPKSATGPKQTDSKTNRWTLFDPELSWAPPNSTPET